MVIFFRGKAATGKSLQARYINEHFNIDVLSKDSVFDELLSEGLSWELANNITYDRLAKKIQHFHDNNRSVVVDIGMAHTKYFESFLSQMSLKSDNMKKFLFDCRCNSQWEDRIRKRILDPNSPPNQCFDSIEHAHRHYAHYDIYPHEDELVIDSSLDRHEIFKSIIYRSNLLSFNAVIFDMDGLMFDTERIFIKAWDYAGEKVGIGRAGYMVEKTLGMSIEMSRDIWREEFGTSYSTKELRRYTKEFLQKYYSENSVPVKDGLFELLEYLVHNGIKMAVASSSPKWEVEKHLKANNIYHLFDVILCGDMVTRSKPDPEIYRETCRHLGEEVNNCIALEDSKSGILSATSAGCRTIMVPDLWEPNREIEELLYAKLSNLHEVQSYLKKFKDVR